ncbi:hypothetical protein [Mammaliicoccus sciuri]|uniref:hypothetical protein n=1 Tax=Mammaliicoccus sciuri TaxID=1296 RepID=UPI001951E90C|nr:hypothetical protein [Mammaliicoccus sciuri]
MRYETTKQKNIEELTEYHFEKAIIIGTNKGFETVVSYDAYNKDKDRYVSDSKVGSQLNNTISTTIRVNGLAILNEDRNSNDKRAIFARFYLLCMKQYSFLADSKDDFLQTFVLLFAEACNNLNELEPLNELLADEKLYNTRIKFIREYIWNNMYAELNPDVVKMDLGRDEEGKHVYVNTILKGIEENTRVESVIDNGVDSVEHGDLLTDENKLFSYGEKSKLSHRMQWFVDNTETILTKSQFEKYYKLKDIYVAKTDSSTKTETKERRKAMLEMVDMTPQQLNQFMKSVSKRVNKKYEMEFGTEMNKLGYSYESRKEMREVFEKFVELADSPDAFDYDVNNLDLDLRLIRQQVLSEYVAENYDREEFELVIIKGFNTEQKREVVRTVLGKQLLSHKAIRLIKQNIVNHLESIKDINVTPATQTTENYSEYMYQGLKEAVIADKNKPLDERAKLYLIDTTGQFEPKYKASFKMDKAN